MYDSFDGELVVSIYLRVVMFVVEVVGVVGLIGVVVILLIDVLLLLLLLIMLMLLSFTYCFVCDDEIYTCNYYPLNY